MVVPGRASRDADSGCSAPGPRAKSTESIQWSDVIGVLSPLWRAVDVAFSSHFVMVAQSFLRSTHSLEAKFKRKNSGRACPTPGPFRGGWRRARQRSSCSGHAWRMIEAERLLFSEFGMVTSRKNVGGSIERSIGGPTWLKYGVARRLSRTIVVVALLAPNRHFVSDIIYSPLFSC